MGTNFVADLGYTGLALPRANIAPLDLLLAGGGGPWPRIGPLEQLVLAGEVERPSVTVDQPSPTVGGTVTRKLEIGLALKILSSFLSVFGANAGLEGKYAHATEADLSFENVTMDYIDLVPLDTYLGAGKVNTAAKNAMLWLNDGKCAVITNVLRSRKISITARRKNEGNVDVNVPAISQAVEAGVKVSAGSEQSSAVTFEAPTGARGVAFGFQGLLLNYSGNVFGTWRTLDAGKNTRLGGTGERPSEEERRDYVSPPRDAVEAVEDVSIAAVPPPAGAA